VNPVKYLGVAFVAATITVVSVFGCLIMEQEDSGPGAPAARDLAPPGSPSPAVNASSPDPSPSPMSVSAGDPSPSRQVPMANPTPANPPRRGCAKVAPGMLRVHLTRTGGLDRADLDLRPFPSLDRDSRAGSIQGRIAPAASRSGHVACILGPARGIRAEIAPDGTFLLGPTFPGKALLAFNMKGEPLALRMVTIPPGKTGTFLFTIGPPGMVTGQVLDGEGVPRYDVRIQIDDQQTRTDSDGFFTLNRVVSGRAVLYAEMEGWVPYRAEVMVKPGATNKLSPVRMESARTFSGLVNGLTREELSEATLFLLPRSHDDKRDAHIAYERLFHLQLDSTGGFNIPYIPRQRKTSLLIYHPKHRFLCNPVAFRDEKGYDPGLELKPRQEIRVNIQDTTGNLIQDAVLSTSLDRYDHSAYFRLITQLSRKMTQKIVLPNVGGKVHSVVKHGPGSFSIFLEGGFPFIDLLARAKGFLPRKLNRIRVGELKEKQLDIQLQKPSEQSKNILVLVVKSTRWSPLKTLQYEGPTGPRTVQIRKGQASLKLEDLPHGVYMLEALACDTKPIRHDLLLSGGTTVNPLILHPTRFTIPESSRKQFNSRPKK